MGILDIEDIKIQTQNSIRTYLYPQQLEHSTTLSLWADGTINQSFLPFSETISSVQLYLADRVGTPDDATITVLSGTVPVGAWTLNFHLGWNTLPITCNNLVTKRVSYMRISCLRSPWNDWVFGASSLTSYWHGDCGTKQLAFNASITDFVYRVYPIANIDSGRVPIVVVDVTGRPRIEERYLNGQAVWVRVNVKTDIFSKYPDEIDKIVTGIDRGVFRDRDNFAGASYSTPGALSDLTYVRPDLFNRSVSFQLYKMISKE